MKATVKAFLALGSNRGDRLAHLRFACMELRQTHAVRVVAASPVYRSEAHTLAPGEEAPPFLNGVVHVQTTLDARALLACCRAIEGRGGRRREGARRWEPRTLDIDILLFGRHVITTPDLSVPHPRMGVRRFVLQPLADLAPDLYVPAPYDATAGELLHTCDDRADVSRTDLTLCLPDTP